MFPTAIAFAQDAGAPDETLPLPSSGTARVRPADRADSVNSWEFTEEQRRAIDHGLVCLAKWQNASGFWPGDGGRYNVAVTALAGLAFLAHGDQPGRSMKPDASPDSLSNGDRIEKAIKWILSKQWAANHPSGAGGLYYDFESADDEKKDKPMHGHGYAMLFLAEALGQTHSPELRQKIHDSLVSAVHLTERTQSREGGWFYKPNDLNKDEGSVTITQIQGLRAAKNAGISVSRSTIDRAVDYIRHSQLKTGDRAGGVRYTIHWGDPSPALTAAGIAVYYGAGEYGSPGIEKGFEYLSKNMRLDDRARFWNYTHFYAVQAMYQRGLPDWKEYYIQLRQQLLGPGGRTTDGGWDDVYAGKCFGTAVAVLCLEVPLCYLPIFQR